MDELQPPPHHQQQPQHLSSHHNLNHHQQQQQQAFQHSNLPQKEGAASKEVRKMTAFILQEASEKAHELHIRADEEYAVEKARLLRTESASIQALFERKQREGEVRLRVAQGAIDNRERLRVEMERVQRVEEEVFEAARARIREAGCNAAAQYELLLRELLREAIQQTGGDGGELVVECRPRDAPVVGRLCKDERIAACIEERISDDAAGGIAVKSKNGKIRCNNTLETRLELAIEAMLPEIRAELFGPSAAHKFSE